MEIYWKYIDKRGAAIAALKDRPYMQYIIDHTDEEIKEKMTALSDPRSISFEYSSSSGDIHSGESKIAGTIDRVSILETRYKEALEYKKWFENAWDALSDDDRYILSEFYGKEHEYGDGVVDELAEYFHIERSSAYRRKNRAVEKLALLLYG